MLPNRSNILRDAQYYGRLRLKFIRQTEAFLNFALRSRRHNTQQFTPTKHVAAPGQPPVRGRNSL
jgi:hypothetical protein